MKFTLGGLRQRKRIKDTKLQKDFETLILSCKDNYTDVQKLGTSELKKLIVLYGFDERAVSFFKAAKGPALYRGAFIGAVTDAGAEREGFGFRVEDFGVIKIDGIVFGKVFFEAVYVIILNVVDGCTVRNNVNFY